MPLTGNSPRYPVFKKPLLVLSALGLLAVLIMLLCTRWGSGLGGDSYFYVSGARNLANGLGFSRVAGTGELRVITHFPPLYSGVLAVSSVFGEDPLSGARWINALVFGGNVFLIGLMLYRHAGSLILAGAGSFLALGSGLMLTVHSWVLTEGLFILLLLLWVLCLSEYLVEHRRVFLLLASGLAAMCFLTRYVGISVIATGLLLVALLPGRVRRRRWADAFWMAVVSLSPPAIWLLHNYLLTGSYTNRVLGWHPMPMERVIDGLEAVSQWLAPGVVPAALRYPATVALLVMMLGAGMEILKQQVSGGISDRHAGTRSFLLVLWTFILAYVLLLAASLSLSDAATPLDGRILSPTFPAALMFLGTGGYLAYSSIRSPQILRSTLVGLLALLGAVSLIQGVLVGAHMFADGQGFASRAWQESELIGFVNFLRPGAPLYSNEIDAIYLLTGRPAALVPIRWDPARDAPATGYQASLETMRSRLKDGRGALILFNTMEKQESFLATVEDLTAGLTPVLIASDGAAYMATSGSSCTTCPGP